MLDEQAEWLTLSARTRSVLASVRINSLRELCDLTDLELLSLKGFASGTLLECRSLLNRLGLMLKVYDPKFDFEPAYLAIKTQTGDKKPFRRVGERFGINGQVAYDLFTNLEKAVISSRIAAAQHKRWSTQFSELPPLPATAGQS